MARYIDAGKLKAHYAWWDISEEGKKQKEIFDTIIDLQPTADVVEVVRCKDCRKWCICHHSDDYYCADGERREDE